MRRTLFLFSFLILCLSSRSYSQSGFFDRSGISMGYSIIDELLPEGYLYTPLTMLGSYSLWKKGRFSFYTELQLTQAINGLTHRADFEFGLNLGVLLNLPVSRQTALSAAIGSGPHYITVKTRRQAGGFIFSDNFEVGIHHHFKSIGTDFNIRGRFRHISNAGLQSPNGGIDNFFIVIGFGKAW